MNNHGYIADGMKGKNHDRLKPEKLQLQFAAELTLARKLIYNFQKHFKDTGSIS